MKQASTVKRFRISLLIVGGVLLLWAFIAVVNETSEVGTLMSQGWNQYAAVIVRNKVSALFHAALYSLAAAGLLYAMERGKAVGRLCWLAVALVTLDAWWLSRHYVRELPPGMIDKNDIVRVLENNPGNQRVAVAGRDGFYNQWMTYLFPAHGIQTLNITQMPRMAEDYKKYLGAMGNRPLRLWQLGAAGYIMGPVQLWQQIQRDPAMKEGFEPAFAYNVAGDPDGGLKIIRSSNAQPGRHVILRVKRPAPRYALIRGWESVAPPVALERLADPAYPLFEKVLLDAGQEDLPPPSGASGMTGRVDVVSYKPGRVELRVSAPENAMLRIADKYDPHWKAWIDGKAVDVLRCDYLFQCVPVEAGEHAVELRFAPPRNTIYLQFAAMGVCLFVLISLIIQPSKPAETHDN